MNYHALFNQKVIGGLQKKINSKRNFLKKLEITLDNELRRNC